MEYPRQITVIQTTAILISSTIGLGFLGMPRRVVEAADSGAPLVTLLGVMLAFASLFFITVLGKSFPKKSLVLYSEDIVGKWPARIGSVLIIAFFIALTASNARGFGIVIKTAVLKETPLELVVIVMLLLAAVASRQDKATFAYIHLFYLPLLLLPGLLIFPLALINVEPIYLLPVWGSDVRGMFSGVLTIAGLLQGSFVLTMIIPAMRQPERAITASLWGMGVAGIICFIVVIITLAVFGQEEIKQLVWPSLDLARATVFPVIERLDAAFLIGYVVTVFTDIVRHLLFYGSHDEWAVPFKGSPHVGGFYVSLRFPFGDDSANDEGMGSYDGGCGDDRLMSHLAVSFGAIDCSICSQKRREIAWGGELSCC